MNLLFPFSDQSEPYAHGVEFGRLLEKIQRGDFSVENNGFPVRVENCSVIAIACSCYGYTAVFGEKAIDGWVDFIGFKKNETKN
jgi:hypothetical protein